MRILPHSLILLTLALLFAGCSSTPPAQLSGAVYDGQMFGLGFDKLSLDQLGHPANPPATFKVSWDLPATWNPPAPPDPTRETSATLSRVATVWQFHQQLNYFDDKQEYASVVEADYFVFDDDSPFHREVSHLLAHDAQQYFADWLDSWNDSLTGPDQPFHLMHSTTQPDDTTWNTQEADLICCTPDIVSFQVMPGSWPTEGGAQTATVFNFVNVGGHAQPFTEADLFIPGSGWEKKLSELCLSHLHDADYVADGTVTGFTPEELSRFTVTPDGLQIYFRPFTLVLGGGDTQADIPWSEIRPYLQPDGPARFFLAFSPTIISKSER